MSKLFALALFLIAATPAAAQPVFEVTAGSWTIYATKDGCSAQNRPNSEVMAEPINALFLFAKPGNQIQIAMFFWPGALTKDDTKMTVHIAGQGTYDLPAKPALDVWSVLRTTDPLPDDLLFSWKGLGTSALYNMDIRAPVSDSRTIIDIQDMPQVMNQLSRCLDLFPPAN